MNGRRRVAGQSVVIKLNSVWSLARCPIIAPKCERMKCPKSIYIYREGVCVVIWMVNIKIMVMNRFRTPSRRCWCKRWLREGGWRKKATNTTSILHKSISALANKLWPKKCWSWRGIKMIKWHLKHNLIELVQYHQAYSLLWVIY